MSQMSVAIGNTGVTTSRRSDADSVERFRDIKETMRQRHGTDIEVTNEMVLSTLCDLYWLHDEREETPALLADGGQP